MAQFSSVGGLTRALSGSPLLVGVITVGAGLEKNNKTTAVPFSLKRGATYLLCSPNGSYTFLNMVSQLAAGKDGGSASVADSSANATNTTTAALGGVPMSQNEKCVMCMSGPEDLIAVSSAAGCDVYVWEMKDT